MYRKPTKLNSMQIFSVTPDENSNRIPTNCEFDQKDKTCTTFFVKVLEFYGPGISTSDKEAVMNKICESSWNQFGKGRYSYIRCVTEDSERVKHNCQNICNTEKMGNDIISDNDA